MIIIMARVSASVSIDPELKKEVDRLCPEGFSYCVEEAIKSWLKPKAYEDYNIKYNFEEAWSRMLSKSLEPLKNTIEDLRSEVEELERMISVEVKEYEEYAPVSYGEEITVLKVSGEEGLGSERRFIDETATMIAGNKSEKEPEAVIDDHFPDEVGEEEKAVAEGKNSEGLAESTPPKDYMDRINMLENAPPIRHDYEVITPDAVAEKLIKNAERREVGSNRGVYRQRSRSPIRETRPLSAVDSKYVPRNRYPTQVVTPEPTAQPFKGKYYEFDGKNPPKIKGLPATQDLGTYVIYKDGSIWSRAEKKWFKIGPLLNKVLVYEGLK